MRFGKTILGRRFGLLWERLPDVASAGITNETEDCMFFPRIDYDNKSWSVVMRDLMNLHSIMGLCTFVVLVNSEETVTNQWGEDLLVGNYGVIGIDKLTFQNHRTMLGLTRCDRGFANINSGTGWARGSWVLRLFDKLDNNGNVLKPIPKVADVIQLDMKCRYDHSSAVRELFEKHFGTKIYSDHWDEFKSIEYIGYKTRRKIWKR